MLRWIADCRRATPASESAAPVSISPARSRIARRVAALGAFGVISALAIALFSGCTVEAAAEIRTYQGINQIRASRGLPPLVADGHLASIARIRSRDMAARGYFSHSPPDGCNYACLMDANGRPRDQYRGENIAWNTYDWTRTADVAVQMWRDSASHLQNILHCRYTRMGTGVARARDGKVYFTMLFEGRGGC
jgi:uncharacterized protein YkwD